MRILIIEDDWLLTRVIQRILTRHDATWEREPVNAIRRVTEAEAAGRAFDLVLCKHELRGITGLDILDALDRRARRPCFVLMTTREADPTVATRVDGVLVKPFAARELRACLAQLVARRVVATRSRSPL